MEQEYAFTVLHIRRHTFCGDVHRQPAVQKDEPRAVYEDNIYPADSIGSALVYKII